MPNGFPFHRKELVFSNSRPSVPKVWCLGAECFRSISPGAERALWTQGLRSYFISRDCYCLIILIFVLFTCLFFFFLSLGALMIYKLTLLCLPSPDSSFSLALLNLFISAFLAVFIPLLLYCSVKSILPWVPCNLFHFWDYVLFYFFPEFSKYSFCIYCFCFVHFPSELPNLWFEVGVFFPPICKYWFKEV